jgi:hypothetical protein
MQTTLLYPGPRPGTGKCRELKMSVENLKLEVGPPRDYPDKVEKLISIKRM